ncbi:MAG: flagellar motor switch protein FliN [Gammaproteobacteria bacterium]|jgi:flagellar motor switch protein FliN/FliY
MDESKPVAEQGGDAAVDESTGRAAGPAQAEAIQSPQYEELSAAAAGSARSHPSLDIVLDVPVTVSLEVGKATMSVGELIRLGEGAIVELDRAVGEPLDVMVNGALVAHGEIVLVNEKFGIRLTSVVSNDHSQQREAG